MKTKTLLSADFPDDTIMLVSWPTDHRFASIEELARWMVENRRVFVIQNIKQDSSGKNGPSDEKQ